MSAIFGWFVGLVTTSGVFGIILGIIIGIFVLGLFGKIIEIGFDMIVKSSGYLIRWGIVIFILYTIFKVVVK